MIKNLNKLVFTKTYFYGLNKIKYMYANILNGFRLIGSE
jgi:hypothetical protein